ncbi:MFS transporter [Lentilactobacillus kosonis]|uniref:Drug resistance transporter, EmrB/QacA family n=1 Tax=Lentilactobacillus kosonis TaxID=2810561 RepID=A0A401FHN2_9LACO|nr:MFS transporter [Lentilactobacillus kosonis]GAY71870.1 drug resistance transporter, EmrB/QacA family [Lentilactobacillus kosonis]
MSREIKVALLMAASLFMEILDGTIVTTALPSMARDFNTNTSSISLLVSIYIITTAVFIPMSGWIAERFGKKRVWIAAVIIFSLSSLGSAFAPNLLTLLGMRVIQGFSGALMTPTARLIVLEKAPMSQLLRLTSYLVWPALIAPALAPVVGGAIITYFSWHWIFLINIPIGMVIAAIGYFLILPDHDLTENSFDWTGFIAIALASIAVLAGFEMATHNGINAIIGLLLSVVGFIMVIPIYRHLKILITQYFLLVPLNLRRLEFLKPVDLCCGYQLVLCRFC